MNFAPKSPKAFKISENDFCFKSTKPIHLRQLVEKLRLRYQKRVLRNFVDFMHHQMNEYE